MLIGRVESERKIRHHQIVVDRLGNADDRKHEVVVQADCHAQRVVAADDDQGIELEPRKMLAQRGQLGLGVPIGIGPRRPEDASTLRDDAVGLGDRERHRHILNQPAPAFQDADAGSPLIGNLLHDGADDGVQAGAVTAAGEQSDLHGIHPFFKNERPGHSRNTRRSRAIWLDPTAPRCARLPHLRLPQSVVAVSRPFAACSDRLRHRQPAQRRAHAASFRAGVGTTNCYRM